MSSVASVSYLTPTPNSSSDQSSLNKNMQMSVATAAARVPARHMAALSLSYAVGAALTPLKTAVMPVRPRPPPKCTAPALHDARTAALSLSFAVSARGQRPAGTQPGPGDGG